MTDYEMLNILGLLTAVVPAFLLVWRRHPTPLRYVMRGTEETLIAALAVFAGSRLLTAMFSDVPYPGVALALFNLTSQLIVTTLAFACLARMERHKLANDQQAVLGKAELARRGISIEELKDE